MVSKAALNEWELAPDRRMRDVINSCRKKRSSLLPICQLDPRRLREKTSNFNFHSDFWDLPKSWSNNQANTIPMYICPKKTNFKTFLEKRNYNKPIFHSPNVFLPLGQALGFHWQGVCECLHAPGHLVEELDIFLSMKAALSKFMTWLRPCLLQNELVIAWFLPSSKTLGTWVLSYR